MASSVPADTRAHAFDHIHPDCIRVVGPWYGFAFYGKAGIPPADLLLDAKGFDPASEGTVELGSDLTHAFSAQLICAQPAVVLRGRQREAVEVSDWRLACESGSAAFHSGKESLERFINSAQQPLAAREVGKLQQPLGPHRSQLIGLVITWDVFAARFRGPTPLLHRASVQIASLTRLAQEKAGLGIGKVKPVLGCLSQTLAFLIFYALQDNYLALIPTDPAW